jgi:C-terminal processing protease CtpA/Prc
MFQKFIVAAALAVAPASALAGDLTPKAASEVTNQLIKGFDTYIDPAIAARAQEVLRSRRPAYMTIDDRKTFAETVTKDLYEATHDLHVKVETETIDAGKTAHMTEAQEALEDRFSARGLMGVRRLPGNIGYLKLHFFDPAPEAAAVIAASLGLLKDTDALIIDLRQNGGGGGAALEELFAQVARPPVQRVRIHWRNTDGSETVEQRTYRSSPGGPPFGDKPVFLLTSRKTFSAAEEFTYDLKVARRATVVGEKTGGAANPANRRVPLSYGFGVFIPNGRVEHPQTHTNWEGVGVSPDIAVPADQALTEAYSRALAQAKPLVATAASERERARALADPKATLLADQVL